jgi:methionine-gamma-lyase
MTFSTVAAREIEDPKTTKPHVLPIYATSSYNFESIDQGMNIFHGKEKGHVYSRYGNPTCEAVAEKIAQLEAFGTGKTAQGLMTSSGMSAISTLFMGLLKSGDKVLTQGNLYGGTTELLNVVFQPLGIEPIMMDLKNLDLVEYYLKKDSKIKLIFCETPANPTLACVDLAEIARIAQKYGIETAIDNTFMSPYLQQPLALGIDWVIHSTTKYICGHGNSIAGIIIGTDASAMHQKVWKMMKLLGTNCSPFEAWLTHIGLKTMPLRIDKHCKNALEIAHFLEKHPNVARVNYTGLESHPDHEIAKKQMRAHGGMLSFELAGGLEAGISAMNRVQLCTLAPTLGDVDTLILHPASMSHLNVAKVLREQHGITDGLVRLSVGIEDSVDIIADLAAAIG